jgi:hypothetical protein
MVVSVEFDLPTALPLGKEPPVPIGYEAGWAPEPVGTTLRREESLAPPGNPNPTVKPVARSYIHYVLHIYMSNFHIDTK